jgi:hypothetical protein
MLRQPTQLLLDPKSCLVCFVQSFQFQLSSQSSCQVAVGLPVHMQLEVSLGLMSVPAQDP